MQRLRVPGARSVAALVPSRLRRTGSLPPVRRVRSDPLLTGAAARRRGAPAARAGSLPRLRRWAWKSALCVYRKVLAADTDGHGELDSGTLLRWMEQVAWLAAEKHAGVPCTTESMNEIVFGDTARVGEILAIRAKVNIQVKARIEVGIEVTVEDVVTKYEKIVTMAYATYEAKPAGAEKIEPKPIELRSEEDYLEYFLSLDRSIFRRDYSKVLQKVMQESSKEDLSKDEQAISTEHTYVQSMELVLPSHTTQQGNTSAGQIMDWIQMVASISASRLCRSQPFLKEISRFTFWRQSVEYDRLLFKASVNNTFKSSVEVGVRVEAFSAEEWAQERPEPQRICSAFLTFSALDEKGEPFTFPRVRPATRDDERRFYEAAVRKRFLFSSMSIVYARAEEPSDMWEERNKAYLNYKNIAALTYVAEKTKWKIALDNSEDNIKVFTDEEGDIRLMKVEMEVNVPFHMAAFLLLDFNHRPTWDKHILACKVVEDVSQSEKIYHLTSGPTAGRQPKDFVVLVSLREPLQADLPYIVAVKSVTHKAMPARLGYNRAQDVCSGFQIHRTGICSCTVCYFLPLSSRITSFLTADKVTDASSSVKDTALACIKFLEGKYLEEWAQRAVKGRLSSVI